MPKISSPVPGTFCWVDITAINAEEGKKFYSNLFDWTIIDTPMGKDQTYTIFQRNGVNVAGLSEQPGQQQAHWNPYLLVENVDEIATRAEELGGKILMKPFDVMDVGRMAVIQDPADAVTLFWQYVNKDESKVGHAAVLQHEPGAPCWTELITHDTKKAEEFYTKLLSWTAETKETNGSKYTIFLNDGIAAAGMIQIAEEWKYAPAAWMVYFGVKNCKDTLEKAVSAGATALVEPTVVENWGHFAVLQSPQKAVFGIISIEKEQSGS